MATEDDNFDIDIYGDGGAYNANEHGDYKQEEPDITLETHDNTQNNGAVQGEGPKHSNGESHAPNNEQVTGSETANPPQGLKRKEFEERPSDPDATTALLVSDLFWWSTDDDIRGWANKAGCEDELKEVTFSEHKVNGKSKGQAYVEFTTTQAATATKHKVDSINASGQIGRRHTVAYIAPQPNPFRTLPKDTPMRKDFQSRGPGGFSSPVNTNMNYMNNMGGGFRGRGGFNRGGGMNNHMGGYRNFSNPNPMGGFQGGYMVGNGFQGGQMGGMPNYGGFNNRGNMMGGMRGGMRGRGGPGGMTTSNMMGMPTMGPAMGGMGMAPMTGGMNPMMGGMGGGMGLQGKGGFSGPTAPFNQGFFPPNQGMGDGPWNPHGAKRSRQE